MVVSPSAPAASEAPRAEHATWQRQFVAMLPRLTRYLRMAFAQLRGEARQEAIQRALVSACVAYARLAQQGRTDRAFAGVLARHAAGQVREGRSVGTRQNVRDVLSPQAGRWGRVVVERLDRWETPTAQWRAALVEDRRTPVLDQVCFRLDFAQWLARLSPRRRRIAEALALGHSTGDVARRFGLSSGRVSQLRRALHLSWCRFRQEPPFES